MCSDLLTDSVILPYSETLALAQDLEKIFLRMCTCRAEMNNCPPSERHVCLLSKNAPKHMLKNAILITKGKALEILGDSLKKSYIHRVFYRKDSLLLTEICNCCFCCCKPNNTIKQNGSYEHELKSNNIAFTKNDLCIHCGTCAQYCFFEARKISDGILTFDSKKCFGCGVCVNKCQSNAISIKNEYRGSKKTPRIVVN